MKSILHATPDEAGNYKASGNKQPLQAALVDCGIPGFIRISYSWCGINRGYRISTGFDEALKLATETADWITDQRFVTLAATVKLAEDEKEYIRQHVLTLKEEGSWATHVCREDSFADTLMRKLELKLHFIDGEGFRRNSVKYHDAETEETPDWLIGVQYPFIACRVNLDVFRKLLERQ